jgi:hypothetical protein
MKQLIVKYSILLISAFILARLFTTITMVIWPDILTKANIDGSTTTYSFNYLEQVFKYVINIAFIIVLAYDLKKQQMKSIPILVVTFFSSLMGVLFFLLFAAQKKLIANTNKQ